MAKATEGLTATLHVLNRRSLLCGGSLAAVTFASPTASPASGMAAAPSPAGRRILALIAELQALDAVWENDEDASSIRSIELSGEIEVIGKSVTSRPIASVSDIIDRAILAAWAGLPPEGDDVCGLKNAYVADVLALAGI